MDKISTHILREYLAGNKIVAYYVGAIDAQGLYDWSTEIVNSLLLWKSDRYLALHDLSRGVSIPLMVLTHFNILDPGLTRAGQSRVEEIMLEKPELTIRLALVLPSTTSGRLATTRGRSSFKINASRIKTQIFVERYMAMKWLEGFLAPDSAGK